MTHFRVGACPLLARVTDGGNQPRASAMARARLLALFFLGLSFVGIYGFNSADTRADPCDHYLKSAHDDPNGYRPRGDRCEGLYTRDVTAMATLRVVSFTELFTDYDGRSGADLQVDWSPFGEEPVHVRAYGLRRRLYYRMDTLRPAGSQSWAWPSGMLGALGVARRELGVVAWTEHKVGENTREILLPLRIVQRGTHEAPKGLELVLQASVELSEVFLSLAVIEQSGRPLRVLRRDDPLAYGYYPAERQIPVNLAGLPDRGLYRLDVGASLRGGGMLTTTIWLYHAGR